LAAGPSSAACVSKTARRDPAGPAVQRPLVISERLVYHRFGRIYGYLSGLSRPEQVVHFFRNVVGVVAVDKEVLSQRTTNYQAWWKPLPAIIGCRLSGPRRGCARKITFRPGNAA
jgi:hypothetical protein